MMRPPCSSFLSALAGTVAVLGQVQPAAAAEEACSAPTIEADAMFAEHYADRLEPIRRELTARQHIDACARILLRQEADVISAVVTLPDGRTATRTVARIEDVVPTLQALLLVPERTPSAPPRPVPPRAAGPAPVVRFSNRREREVNSAAWANPRAFGLELSVISGARIGDGQFAFGLGALSLIEVRSLLIGFEGRADSYRPLNGGDPETALELALLGGKRLHFGNVALDLTIGPGIAMKGLAFSRVERVQSSDGDPPSATTPADHHQSEPSSGPVPRVLIGARLGFRSRSAFRTFVGIDGEFGPTRAPRDANIISPRMPSYSVGLALGATVGTP